MKEEQMHHCYLAMGGNVGNVTTTFAKTLRLLDESPEINLLQTSSYHKTIPVGDNAGTETVFLNGACEIETSLEPLPLLDELQSIEKQLGRKRTLHWGPRTLDLDIILYGQQKIDHMRLQVPHPACWYRRFVLDPLVEIAGDIVHPTKGVTVKKLRERLLQQPFIVALTGGDAMTRQQFVVSLQKKFPDIIFEEWNSLHQGDQQEPTLLIWLGKGEADEDDIDFESLPLLSRIDLSQEPGRTEALHDIIRAATN